MRPRKTHRAGERDQAAECFVSKRVLEDDAAEVPDALHPNLFVEP